MTVSLDIEYVGNLEFKSVKVFGLALHHRQGRWGSRQEVVYVNFVGPTTACQALWAKLADGKPVQFTDLAGKGAHPLKSREADGPLLRHATRIAGLNYDQFILLDPRIQQPDYDLEISSTYVLQGVQAHVTCGVHINNLVDLAVETAWYNVLYALGKKAGLITPIQSYGPPFEHLSLDRLKWNGLIAAGVQQKLLPWPGEPQTDASQVAGMTDEAWKQFWGEALKKSKALQPGAVGEVKAVKAAADTPVTNRKVESVGYKIVHKGDWTWLWFEDKPGEAVREAIKGKLGMRWQRKTKAWYASKPLTQIQIEKSVGYAATQVEIEPHDRDEDSELSPDLVAQGYFLIASGDGLRASGPAGSTRVYSPPEIDAIEKEIRGLIGAQSTEQAN